MNWRFSLEDYPSARTEADRLRLRRLYYRRIVRLIVFFLTVIVLAIGLWLQNRGYFYVVTVLMMILLTLLNTSSDRYFLLRMRRTETPPPRVIDDQVIGAALWKPVADGFRLFFRLAGGWELCMLLLPLYAMLCNGAAYVAENYFGFLVMQLLMVPPMLIVGILAFFRKRQMHALAVSGRVEVVYGVLSAQEKEEYPERPDEYFLVFYELGKYGIQRMRVREAAFLESEPGRDAYYLLLTNHGEKYRLRAALPADKWLREEPK